MSEDDYGRPAGDSNASADRHAGENGPPVPDEGAVVLRLPDALRGALRDPLGPVTTDTEAVVERAGSPLIAVGDIVTYRIEGTGTTPDAAFVDGRTQREAVDPAITAAIGNDCRRLAATNPAGTITESLLDAVTAALDGPAAVVDVDGEEDLAALPAIAAAPDGASVCYGQPDEGMVHVRVDDASRRRAVDLLARMDGDHDRLWRRLGVAPPAG